MPPPKNSLAIVTGATAGIGRVFADRLARRGHPLLLIARDEQRLAHAADGLRTAHGAEVRTLAADLSRDDEIQRVAALLAAESNPGVLVNNAGFGSSGKLHTIDADVQAQMVRLHTLAPMLHTRAVLPAMVSRGAGWIINVSSVAGFTYSPGNVNYASTKAYITRFSQALNTELGGTGVVVQALCPGFTHTEFHARAQMDMRAIPEWMWSSADDVVDASIRAAGRGRPVVLVPGMLFRLITLLLKVTPPAVMRWGSRFLKRDVWRV
jgi:hypothetical protein